MSTLHCLVQHGLTVFSLEYFELEFWVCMLVLRFVEIVNMNHSWVANSGPFDQNIYKPVCTAQVEPPLTSTRFKRP